MHTPVLLRQRHEKYKSEIRLRYTVKVLSQKNNKDPREYVLSGSLYQTGM